MAIPNQINHREAFRKQLAQGSIADMTAGRHGRRVRPAQAARRAALRRKAAKPQAGLQGPADGRTLAERLGMPVATPSVKATPLKDMIPPATANVPETATPEVQFDPPVGEGELPPVAALTQSDVPASELLAPVRVDAAPEGQAVKIDAEDAELQRMIHEEEAAEAAEEPTTEDTDGEETDADPLL